MRLISKAIRDRDIAPLLEAGITPDWWANPDVKDVWRWLIGHWSKYGVVATATTVRAEFPTFTLLRVNDSLQYLVDKFVEYRRAVKVTDALQGMAEILETTNDHDAAKTFMQAALADVDREMTLGVTDMNLVEKPLDRFVAYEVLEQRGGGLLGLPTGFAQIDEATSGLQPGQLVTFIATPKVGKSQLALMTAMNMHIAGHDVMFQSFEMSNDEQQVRHDAARAQVSHQRMRRATLTAAEKAQYRKMLIDLDTMANAIMLTDSVEGLTTSAISALIDKHKPEVAFIDGVYLMMDEQTGESNTPQALTNITRTMKRMAKAKNIPIVISTQTLPWKTKNGKATADAIGYSSSFFQDSDVIIGLELVPDEDEQRELKVVESRNCGKTSVRLVWRWDTGCFHEQSLTTTCRGCAVAKHFAPTVPGQITP